MSENVETCCNYCVDRVDIIGDLTTGIAWAIADLFDAIFIKLPQVF